MSKTNEISSIEDLDQVLRNEKELNNNNKEPLFVPGNRFVNKRSVSKGKNRVVVGIVPRDKEIILVKSDANQNGYHTLIDYNICPIPDDVTQNSPEYIKTLKACLSSFCSSDKKIETWCVIPSMDVSTKRITIPSVSPKKLYNAVYWSFKSEIAFDEQKFLFDFNIIGKHVDNGVEKTEVLAYVAPLKVINTLKDLFIKAKIPLHGVSITVFGIQNFLQTQFLQVGDSSVCTLFVGDDWSRIDIFTEKNLYLSRDIKTGYQSFLHCIENIIPKEDHNQSEINHLVEDFFTHKLVYSEIDSFEENKHFSKIEPVTDRLVKQIERTFEFFLNNSGKTPIKKLYLTGRLCDFTQLLDYLSKKLDISVEVIDSFAESEFQNTPIFQLKSVADVYLPAFAMSCSSNDYTPNLIYPFKDKEKVRKAKVIDWIFIFIVFLIFLSLSGVSFWQRGQIRNKKTVANQIQTQQERLGSPVTEEMILKKNNEILKYQESVKNRADDLSFMAAISEISLMTQKNIHLTEMMVSNLTIEGESNRFVSAKGYIFGKRLLLDASLAGYRETLNGSDLYYNITVLKKLFTIINDADAIYFEIKMDMIQDL